MARGWESKSVEAQQAEATAESSKGRTKLTPEAAARARERDLLLLSRKRVLNQLESAGDPRHKHVLQRALMDLDNKIKALID